MIVDAPEGFRWESEGGINHLVREKDDTIVYEVADRVLKKVSDPVATVQRALRRVCG